MVLGKLPVPGRPTNLDKSSTRAYCVCSRCGGGGVGLDIFFLSSIISFFFLPLWETARYRLKYCIKGPLSPKQPTNPPPFQRKADEDIFRLSVLRGAWFLIPSR